MRELKSDDGMIKMDNKKRNDIVDIYKGIGIVLVLMGHIGFGVVQSYIAHAFHMPMFFFISGFLYNDKKNNNVKEWIWHKSKKLLYPYFLFGIINYFLYMLVHILKKEAFGISPLKHLFFINTTGLAGGSLWFLTALFVANILFFIINRGIRNEWIKYCFVTMISLMGILAVKYLPFRLPYALDAGMVGTGLLFIGYWMHNLKKKEKLAIIFNLSIPQLIVGCVIFSFLILQNGEINMRNGLYHNILLFWINAVAGSVITYNFSRYLNKWKEEGGVIIAKGVQFIERIGKYSLIYVCLNDQIAAEIKILLMRLSISEGKLSTIFVHVITLFATMGVIDFVIRYTPIVSLLNQAEKVNIMKEEN